MSFGFSVSDFIYCAQLAYKLSVEFKEATGACRHFTKELLVFHQILLKTQSLLENKKHDLDGSGQSMLAASAHSCKELLYVQILGCKNVPTDIASLTFDNLPMFYEQGRFLQGLRRKLGERNFYKKIPEFQAAISARIDALTAVNVILISNDQVDMLDSQARSEAAYGRLEEDLKSSRVRSESTAIRLEQGQARMEAQLQHILASQQRKPTPILSQSLDASSPKGRRTWMDLGRLLRAEGITPAMIDQNRELLVKAMKTSLEEADSLSESFSESYRTAPEWHDCQSPDGFRYSIRPPPNPSLASNTYNSYSSSTMLLSSAPPSKAAFSDAFLDKYSSRSNPLDQNQNVAIGMESLLSGMDAEDLQDIDIDDVDLEHNTTGLAIRPRDTRIPPNIGIGPPVIEQKIRFGPSILRFPECTGAKATPRPESTPASYGYHEESGFEFNEKASIAE